MGKLKTYTVKCTVWEYYEVEAPTAKDALAGGTENPYFVDYRNKRIVSRTNRNRRHNNGK